MENTEINALISTFKEYRDLLTPIEQNLKMFSASFESIREDIKNLNSSFDESLQSKLDNIYKELSLQAQKAKNLTSEVDRFLTSTNKYVASVDNLTKVCENIESKLNKVDEVEARAEKQIERLDNIIEEKRKSYDIKQLQQNLDKYNVGVEKISKYIDTDVSDALKTSGDKISAILQKNENIHEAILNEHESLDKLLKNFETSNKLIKQIVENTDVNEQYIFEILDKWAEDRNLKIKK